MKKPTKNSRILDPIADPRRWTRPLPTDIALMARELSRRLRSVLIVTGDTLSIGANEVRVLIALEEYLGITRIGG